METPFYITTPLYYVNEELHIGHATTTIYADTLARFWRAWGRPVLFLTGTDEHGQKIFKAAAAAGILPRSQADRIVGKVFELWEALDIQYDAFIRTTDEFHERAVQRVFERLRDNDMLYKAKYRALYCVDCETNYTEKDLTDGKCPIHHTTPQVVEEDNYFFKLSAFEARLRERLESEPDCLLPESRRNEMLGRLREELNDISVTRVTFDWGVAVPWEPQHVIWVWTDALVNYISALGWPDSPWPAQETIAGRARHAHPPHEGESAFAYWWPYAVHLIGKEITWHHSIVWWSELWGAGLTPPRQVFAHGWWTIEGEKMSKSLGNVIRPGEFAATYGRDAMRYHILREGPARGDADWRQASFIARYNADLANGLGNLVNRSLSMLHKYFGGIVPQETAFENKELEAHRRALITRVNGLGDILQQRVHELDLDGACEAIWELVRDANVFVNSTAPFKLAKDETRRTDLQAAMHGLTEVNRVLAHALRPFLPDAAQNMARQLAIALVEPLPQALAWGGLAPGHAIGEASPLFARLES
jgi:methionyl-tRNA synthetase